MRMERIDKENTCCFSGYRTSKLPWGTNEDDSRCVTLKEKVYDVVHALYLAGVRHFMCGMAQGADTYFCEEVVRLRESYDDVTIEAATPCETQAVRWDEETRNRYFRLVSECDYETLVGREYTADCMIKRNRYMVDNSSVLLTVYDGKFGGTMHTVNYAEQNGLEIIQIKP